MEPIHNQVTSVSRRALSFSDLAFELREQIFENCDLSYSSRGHFFEDLREWPTRPFVPALIIALRPQPEVYRQALEHFYQQSTKWLHEWNNWSFPRTMTPHLMETVQRLCVIPRYVNRIPLLMKQMLIPRYSLKRGWTPRRNEVVCRRITPKWITAATTQATGIKEVDIRWDMDLDIDLDSTIINMGHYPTGFPLWIAALPNAESLTRVSTAFPHWPRWEKDDRDVFLSSIVNHISKQVGVVARMTGFEGGKGDRLPMPSTKAEIWEWKAEPGKVMNWSNVTARDHRVWYFWDQDVMLLEQDEAISVIPISP